MTRQEYLDRLAQPRPAYTQQHLDRHIEALNVGFWRIDDWKQSKCVSDGLALSVDVQAPGASSLEGYWATLHELGHAAVNRSAHRGFPRIRTRFDQFEPCGGWSALTLAHEAAAWRWAFDHSEVPLCDTVRGMLRSCLGNYFLNAAPGAVDNDLAADFRTLLDEVHQLRRIPPCVS